jgi:hypothetical protein
VSSPPWCCWPTAILSTASTSFVVCWWCWLEATAGADGSSRVGCSAAAFLCCHTPKMMSTEATIHRTAHPL